MDYKSYISSLLTVPGMDKETVANFIEVPPTNELGDYALPCFKFASVFRKSPIIIAEELASTFTPDEVISEVSAVKGYLNFKVNRNSFAVKTLTAVLNEKDNYGADNIGNGKTICIDYSSINIAKPFHIGHLSTTVIGSSLCKIFRFLGYKVVGINHLGDYGTQFGKLIVAFKKWSSVEQVNQDRLKELTRIYVKFHDEAEKDESLNDEARRYFKLIEDGDKEAGELFNLFKKITLEEVDKIYKMLNVTFDSYNGESFYNDKMQPVVDELEEKGLLKTSEGAKIVDLEEYGMSPCLILKADGSSLYATRDLAAAIYRKNTYNFDKCLYVVAYQQNLHFKQFFKVLDLMGKEWAKDCVHVSYGMVSLEDGAMSTRHGKVVLLEDVINKTVEKARQVIENKNPALPDKDDIAVKIGTGSVIFGALCNNKIKDIVFSIDKVLNFDGETCPYVQYTVARCNSVIEKSGVTEYDLSVVKNYEISPVEYELISKIASFKEIIISASEKYEPSFITRYAVDLASAFNKFYIGCPILNSGDNEKKFRLILTEATRTVLTNALKLLGIETVEKM